MTIGEEIASRLGVAAASRALDPWPSMIPDTGEVIMAMVGGSLRPVAHASTWVVRASAPPSVGSHEWRWGSEAYPIGEKPRIPYDEIAGNLARVIDAWRAHEDEVGLLDVALDLVSGLPEPRGGLRASPSAREVSIGVERGSLHWPQLAYVRELGDAIEIVQSGPTDDARLVVRTRQHLKRARQELGLRTRLLEAFCEKFVAEKRALEDRAARLCDEIPRLPHRGRNWKLRHSLVETFGPRDTPVAWIDATSGAYRVTSGTTAEEIAKHSQSACPLREGYRYRVKQAFRGLAAGEIIRLAKEQPVHPSDAMLYVFDKTTLSEAEDSWILDALGEWLDWIDE